MINKFVIVPNEKCAFLNYMSEATTAFLHKQWWHNALSILIKDRKVTKDMGLEIWYSNIWTEFLNDIIGM